MAETSAIDKYFNQRQGKKWSATAKLPQPPQDFVHYAGTPGKLFSAWRWKRSVPPLAVGGGGRLRGTGTVVASTLSSSGAGAEAFSSSFTLATTAVAETSAIGKCSSCDGNPNSLVFQSVSLSVFLRSAFCML